MTDFETQKVRAQMMRCMPEWQREPAIRGGVRMGVVIDARLRFPGERSPLLKEAMAAHPTEARLTTLSDFDPFCDGDIA